MKKKTRAHAPHKAGPFFRGAVSCDAVVETLKPFAPPSNDGRIVGDEIVLNNARAGANGGRSITIIIILLKGTVPADRIS